MRVSPSERGDDAVATGLIQPGFLHQRRMLCVVEELASLGVQSLLDLGCGHGDLVDAVLAELEVSNIVGIDRCSDAIAQARRRFIDVTHARVTFVEADICQASDLSSRPDAAVLLEVIEHLDVNSLRLMESALVGQLRPRHILITTPNVEYNHLLGVPPDRLRHPDHEFEWDRQTFRDWAEGLANRYGYAVQLRCVAGRHNHLGGPSQMARFSLPVDMAVDPKTPVHGSHVELGCCAATRFGDM